MTVYADPQQKIFEEGASEDYILERMKLERRSGKSEKSGKGGRSEKGERNGRKDQKKSPGTRTKMIFRYYSLRIF